MSSLTFHVIQVLTIAHMENLWESSMVGNSGRLNYNDLETCEDKWDIMKINDYTAIKRTHPQKNGFMNWIYTCHEAQPFYTVARPNMWLWWDGPKTTKWDIPIQNLEDPDLHAGNQQLSDGFFLGLHNQKPPTSENFNHPTSAKNKKQTRWLFDKITGHVEVIRSTYDVQGDAGRDDSAKWAKTEILADRLLTTVRVLGV